MISKLWQKHYNTNMTLTTRIKAYLDNHAAQWVPAPLIYSLANKHGYSHDEIKRALSEIAHTQPYATWSVSAGDYHALREPGVTGKGVYYRAWNMTAAELEHNKQALDAFDAL